MTSAEDISDDDFVVFSYNHEQVQTEDGLAGRECSKMKGLSDQRSFVEKQIPPAPLSMLAKDMSQAPTTFGVQPAEANSSSLARRVKSAEEAEDCTISTSQCNAFPNAAKLQELSTLEDSDKLDKNKKFQKPIQGRAGKIPNKIFFNPNDEEFEAMEKVYGKGLKLDARDAVKDILELILTVVILRRSKYESKERMVFKAEDAEKALKAFTSQFNETQRCALDLLFELEDLDTQLLTLYKNCFYFGEDKQELLEILANIGSFISLINEIDPNRANTSKVYRNAVQFYESSLPRINFAISGNAKQLSNEVRGIINRMSQQLKLGTLHEIVTDLNIDMRELANLKLNDQMFYPQDKRKYRYRPPLPKGARHAEDHVDSIERQASTDADVDAFFKEMNDLSTAYFSMYIPELGENASHEKVLIEAKY